MQDLRPLQRSLVDQILRDLQRKMVFVAGPRQVGKTTLAQGLPGAEAGYLNWDIQAHREKILRRELPANDLWIFDEIHKYRLWRNYLKGLYDGRPASQRILVTGSARLDLYRYSGDSLQGRYHLLRLHPLSLAELGAHDADTLEQLFALGGFPEPFFSGSEVEARRWSRDYRNLLIREEVTDLEQIRDLGQLEMLMLRLPELVGSPLSINALSEDLQVAHKTVGAWVRILEKLYGVFRLAPFTRAPRIRAVKKAQKHYHFDWTLVREPSLRFENLIASHLLKWVHYRQDTEGLDLDLRYFRDRDGREVDFVVVDGLRPVLLVECKWKDSQISAGLRTLVERFPGIDAWQVSARGTKDYRSADGIRVAPALRLLSELV